jgi:hypothetical protein
MKIEVSNGELLDKLSILLIKNKKITNDEKLLNINNEIDELKPLCDSLLINEVVSRLFMELSNVNYKLWIVEDELRILEKKQQFDIEFIELARAVYILNDERASIKKEINKLTNSFLVEEKSYENY